MTTRNFNSISPSARALSFTKAYTTIPYALQTAELMASPEKFTPDFTKKEMPFWARVLHFEHRYLSVNDLLDDLKIKNVLELSSGYSFRGLDKATKSDYYYIDTDLPDVITEKKVFIDLLMKEKTKGTLELLPLNALDEDQFRDIVSHFPPGEIAIVNEGLLMYLDEAEKEKLCVIIHRILKERGGYWITADIYLKNKMPLPDFKIETLTKEFFEKHKVEEKKFESFDDAKAFFKKMGFVIDQEAKLEHSKLSSFPYFKKSLKLKHMFKFFRTGRMQATWRLKIAEEK